MNLKANNFINIKLILISVIFLVSCQKETKKVVDFENLTQIDSIIKNEKVTKDSIFLNFKIDMTKKEFLKHIQTLKKTNINIVFEKENILYYPFLKEEINFGEGYVYKTEIIKKDYNNKDITGQGTYILLPKFKNDKLNELQILTNEKWNDINGFSNGEWIEDKISENSEFPKLNNLKEALIKQNFLNESDFVYEKNNTIIYKNLSSINYISRKNLLEKLKDSIRKKENIRKKNNNLKI